MAENSQKIIAIASDHAGYNLKSVLIGELKSSYKIVDLGCDDSEKSVDYPDFAQKLSSEIEKNPQIIGILICGSGIGVSIAANRNKKVRAALCMSPKMAELSKLHNDANVVCLGARLVDEKMAKEIVKIFLTTEFEGKRHEKRVKKMS